MHLAVNQRQFQPQFAPCVVPYIDLPKRKLVLTEFANLWIRHVPSACQVVLAYKRLLEKVLQGVKPVKDEMVKKPAKLPPTVKRNKVKHLLFPKLVKVAVKKAVWRNHVRVYSWVSLVPCWSYQVRKWVVQNCLRWRKGKLV